MDTFRFLENSPEPCCLSPADYWETWGINDQVSVKRSVRVRRTYPKSKTAWRREGRGVKKKQVPFLVTQTQINLYKKSQTTLFRPYTRAKNHLIDLFADYPTKFKATTKNGRIVELDDSSNVPPNELIARGWNYQACATGIGLWQAESFHIYTYDMTRFVVIDVDNHEPTHDSTAKHLNYIKRLLIRLPEMMTRVGAASSFLQYRSISPTGVHIWLVLKQLQCISYIHEQLRSLLDKIDNSVVPELLPTSSHTISMIGAYGRSVYARNELKIKNSRFDCESLSRFIRGNGTVSPKAYERYEELCNSTINFLDSNYVKTSLINIAGEAERNVTEPKSFWDRLRNIALNGVDEQDTLYENFLRPLAYALIYRDLYGIAGSAKVAINLLNKWIQAKHNNHVTRINYGRHSDVLRQIQHTVKGVVAKPNAKVLQFYAGMRDKDRRFPHNVESIASLMEAPARGILILGCKGTISTKQTRPKILCFQPSYTKNINKYIEKNIRKGKFTKNFKFFVKMIVAEIGINNVQHISHERFVFLLKRKISKSTLKTYKRHLVLAGVLQPGWSKYIIRGKRSSGYSLSDVARRALVIKVLAELATK